MEYPYHYLALTLDGRSYVESPSDIGIFLNASQDFSIDAWLRIGTNQRIRTILSQNDVFAFEVDGLSVCFRINGMPVVCSDPEVFPLCDGQWHYVCVSFLQPWLFLYVDGIQCGMVSCLGPEPKNNNPFIFGEGIIGNLREVRIYKRALSTDEVKFNMLNEPALTSLQARYDFRRNPPEESVRHMVLELKENAFISDISGTGIFREKQFVEFSYETFFLSRLQQPYSIQLWMKFSPREESQLFYSLLTVCNRARTVGAELYILKSDSGYKMEFKHGVDNVPENIVTSQTELLLERWVNIAVVRDVDSLSLFIDGVLEGHTEGLFPISESVEGEQILYVGSDAFSGEPSGDDWFQGGISRLDLWGKALTNNEIKGFRYEFPDLLDTNLIASCDFFGLAANNSINAAPIFSVNGFDVNEMSDQAASGVKEPELLRDIEVEPLSTEQLEELRFKVLGKKQSVEKMQTGELLGVNSIRNGNTIYYVVHYEDTSYTVSSVTYKELVLQAKNLGMTPEEVVWWVELLLIILGGVFAIILGVKMKMNTRLHGMLSAKVITIGAVRTLAFTNFGMNVIVSLFGILLKEGLLWQLLKTALELGFWALCRAFTKLLAFPVWILWAVDIALLVEQVVSHIRNKPKEIEFHNVSLKSITFNHGDSSCVSALNIRSGKINTIRQDIPEWTGSPEIPVLYNLASLVGDKKQNTIGLKCEFETSENSSFSIMIRARDISFANGVLLGDSTPLKVEFFNNRSTPVMLKFPSSDMVTKGILNDELYLTWEYSSDKQKTWQSFYKTTHELYTVLDTPTDPWGTTDVLGETSRPWIDALKKIYPYVKGVTNMNDLYKNITLAVNGSFGLNYVSGPQFSVVYKGNWGFDLESFLSPKSSVLQCNCTDCATIVTTFANLYGGKLYAGCMLGDDPKDTSFQCNKIQEIGKDVWAYPGGASSGGGFTYHEVAFWKDSKKKFFDNMDLKVCDACLKVNNSSTLDEETGTAVVPVMMSFSQQKVESVDPYISPLPDDSYREHLALKGIDGINKCIYQGTWDEVGTFSFSTLKGHRPVELS